MDHDARFKLLLKSLAVLRGFFDGFLPQVSGFIDFTVLEFVDKERFTAGRKKRTGDLLVKTRLRGEAAGFLIHLEHQAQPDWDLGRRMLEYFTLDWRDFDLPVYPVAVLSHAEPAGDPPSPICVDFPNGRVLMFRFEVIDLARMDAAESVTKPNPALLALASRMRFDPARRVMLTRDFFISLAGIPLSREDQHLVAGFFSGYQPLSDGEALQLEQEMSKVIPDMAREKIIEWTNPFIRLGVLKGLDQGRQEGRREGRRLGEVELVLKLLHRRLGALTGEQEEVIRSLRLRGIEALGEALLDFRSRSDLNRWLKAHSG